MAEIPEHLRSEQFVRLKSMSISKAQSDFLYKHKVSPQKLLADAIEKLMKDVE